MHNFHACITEIMCAHKWNTLCAETFNFSCYSVLEFKETMDYWFINHVLNSPRISSMKISSITKLLLSWTLKTVVMWMSGSVWHLIYSQNRMCHYIQHLADAWMFQTCPDMFESFLHLYMIHLMSSGLLLSIYPNIFSDCLPTNSIWLLSVLETLNDQKQLFRTKTLNTCLLVMSDFIGYLLNVLVSSLSIIIQITI